jgi:hypothetical protein
VQDAGSLQAVFAVVTWNTASRRMHAWLQDDNLSPIMTSREVLAFHAAMQLPDCNSKRPEPGHLQGVAVCSGSQGTSEAQQQQQQLSSRRPSRVGELAVQEVLTTVGLSKHASTLVRARLKLLPHSE